MTPERGGDPEHVPACRRSMTIYAWLTAVDVVIEVGVGLWEDPSR